MSPNKRRGSHEGGHASEEGPVLTYASPRETGDRPCGNRGPRKPGTGNRGHTETARKPGTETGDDGNRGQAETGDRPRFRKPRKPGTDHGFGNRGPETGRKPGTDHGFAETGDTRKPGTDHGFGNRGNRGHAETGDRPRKPRKPGTRKPGTHGNRAETGRRKPGRKPGTDHGFARARATRCWCTAWIGWRATSTICEAWCRP